MSDNPTQEPKPYEPVETPTEIPQPEAGARNDLPRGRSMRARRSGDNWVWGIILIIMGGIFLIQNLTSFQMVNWWAIFILIPAAGSFASAWRKYKDEGKLGRSARGALFGGVILCAVAAIFLFNLDIGQLWPVFIIAAGLAVMVNSLLPD